MRRRRSFSLVLFLLAVSTAAFAGGPILVGGPGANGQPFGKDGQPFTWDPAKMPIAYRVDPGPMAVNPSGAVVISNAAGLQRIQNMFGVWQAVPTANVSFTNSGALLPAGSYTSGDLHTVQQFNDIMGSCQAGTQSPVIFDADGKIMSGLGLPPEVIGFTSGCDANPNTGRLVSAAIVMNGTWQDGINGGSTQSNGELTANQFDEAMTHEIGHFLGLDHAQINVDVLTQNVFPCDLNDLAGLPVMFPIAACQARKDAGLPALAPDDVAWISTLYPNSSFVSNYGTITGTIFFSDGVTQLQDANVIARSVDDPTTPEDETRRIAVSVVSGFLFTGNPGQSVTGDNLNGDPNGSRNPSLIGYYEIHVPPGTYTVEVESINAAFVGGSSVGPLPLPVPLPGPAEFWNQDESAFDLPLQRDTITVHTGDKITGIDIILNSTPSRFDQYEDSGAIVDPPAIAPDVIAAEQVRA